MENIKIILILILVLLFSFQNVPGQDEECDECVTNPASCCDEFPGICKPPPGNDHADDTLSVSNLASYSSFTGTGKGTVTIMYFQKHPMKTLYRNIFAWHLLFK